MKIIELYEALKEMLEDQEHPIDPEAAVIFIDENDKEYEMTTVGYIGALNNEPAKFWIAFHHAA